jgi:hypothetical protein
MPGWIGAHDHPQEFHDAVLQDIPFSCHMSAIARKESPLDSCMPNSKSQHCVGYMLYMNRMIKSSRRPEVSQRQRELKELNHLVVDPWKKEVITIHLEAMTKPRSKK